MVFRVCPRVFNWILWTLSLCVCCRVRVHVHNGTRPRMQIELIRLTLIVPSIVQRDDPHCQMVPIVLVECIESGLDSLAGGGECPARTYCLGLLKVVHTTIRLDDVACRVIKSFRDACSHPFVRLSSPLCCRIPIIWKFRALSHFSFICFGHVLSGWSVHFSCSMGNTHWIGTTFQ